MHPRTEVIQSGKVRNLDVTESLTYQGTPFVPSAATDEKAKVSSNDTTPGYLNGKLVAGTNVTLTENNNGGNETLTISAAGGLTGFTSATSTTGVNITVNASQLLVDATSVNADIVLQPKGSGAILAQLPDGTTTGGNKRNSYSVDLQTVRSNANQVASGAYSVIAGGSSNRVSSSYGSISGGINNSIVNDYGFIGGGNGNAGLNNYAVVAGGQSNQNYGQHAFIGGGQLHFILATHATISGGFQNNINGGSYAFIGGGYTNSATAYSAVVAGGLSNSASRNYAAISGGQSNTINSAGSHQVIAGGQSNTISSHSSVIVGGSNNTISFGDWSGILSGEYNTIAVSGMSYAHDSVICGGAYNQASGQYSTIVGGLQAKTTMNFQYSYAAGQFATKGDCQYERHMGRATTTNATPTKISSNGNGELYAASKLHIESGATYTFTGLVTARSQTNNYGAGYKIEGVVQNVAGTTAFVGTPTVTVIAEGNAAWNVTLSVDDAIDALIITVTGSEETVRWGAVVEMMKVQF